MSDTQTEREQLLDAAAALGREHAQNMASWIVDGNTEPGHASQLLDAITAGDPAVWDVLGTGPNLSGEWADDLTPTKLALEIGAPVEDDENEGIAADLTDICDAYEDAAWQEWEAACEAELINFTADTESEGV